MVVRAGEEGFSVIMRVHGSSLMYESCGDIESAADIVKCVVVITKGCSLLVAD